MTPVEISGKGFRNRIKRGTIENGDCMSLQRIDKILSSQNIASRSAVKEMIRKGQIMANGKPVKRPDEKFDPEMTEITVNGQNLHFQKHLYLMMNKPQGVLSASRDSHAETVLDLLPPELKRSGLFPAGRLDKDTVGFLLITDDGELAHKMLAPKSHVYKLYQATCDRALTEQDVEAFRQGIRIGELQFLPAEMKIVDTDTALVEICEGKFHQIKKMFHAVGTEVIALKRLRIGGVELDENLAPGECRPLTESEIIALLNREHGNFRKNSCT